MQLWYVPLTPYSIRLTGIVGQVGRQGGVASISASTTGLATTSFHQPRSTLLALVSAFAGRDRIVAAYAEAIRAGYRFLSFGDPTLILYSCLQPGPGEASAEPTTPDRVPINCAVGRVSAATRQRSRLRASRHQSARRSISA